MGRFLRKSAPGAPLQAPARGSRVLGHAVHRFRFAGIGPAGNTIALGTVRAVGHFLRVGHVHGIVPGARANVEAVFASSVDRPPFRRRRHFRGSQAGHTLLIVLLIATIMIIGTTVAAKVWSTVMQREREDELIFRGKQYAQAILLYRKMRGTLPTDLQQLMEKGPKGETVMRQLYKDPITGQPFGLIFSGPNNVPIPDEPIEPNGSDDEDGNGLGSTGFGQPNQNGLGSQNGLSSGFDNTGDRGANPSPNRNNFGDPNSGMNSGMNSAFGTPSGGNGMPIMGVHSKSKALAIGPAKWHDLEHYNQWLFVITDQNNPQIRGNQQGQQPGGVRGPGNQPGTFGGAPDTSGGAGPPKDPGDNK